MTEFLIAVVVLMATGCGLDSTRVAYDWDVLTGDKYRYAGTAVEEAGRRYLFYCGNLDRPERPKITDHIILRVGARNGSEWVYGGEEVVLWPSEKTDPNDYIWDSRHVCDPEVLAGEFWYDGPEQARREKFSYAMFYTGAGEGKAAAVRNQLGWAVAKALSGPWYKVVGNGPLITSDGNGSWGVGQPSATSVDGKGELLLFYTRGDAARTETLWQKVDLSTADKPVYFGERPLTSRGLTEYDGSPDDSNHGGAFLRDDQTDRFYLIRNGHPYPRTCPDFISFFSQVAYMSAADVWAGTGAWTVVADIRGSGSNTRTFDGGWIRDTSGGLVNPSNLEALVSLSEAEGACSDNWLYTYRIHGVILPRTR